MTNKWFSSRFKAGGPRGPPDPPDEMEELLARVYKDIDIFDFNGKNVPRIILDDRKFDDIMSKIQASLFLLILISTYYRMD